MRRGGGGARGRLALLVVVAVIGAWAPGAGAQEGAGQEAGGFPDAVGQVDVAGLEQGAAVPGRYIVEFVEPRDPRRQAAALAGGGVTVGRVYEHALAGAVVQASPRAAEALRRNPRVRSVEPDRAVRVAGDGVATLGDGVGTLATTQTDPPWGLDRIDQRERPLSGEYRYPADGAGVRVYVVDTGIRAAHEEFGGRVVSGFTTIADGRGTSDCSGHGTHVAGTVGAETYGVAKAVTLVPVRVLDCKGAGITSDVIAGLDWIHQQHTPGVPAVVNLSLGSDASTLVDNALQRVIDDGMTAVVAAGNQAEDACTLSPGRLSTAVTVGATDLSDSRDTEYSNHGPCLDLFAPGTAILSTWHSSNSATNTMSGTSIAAPHVAGAAAVLLSQEPTWTPEQVTDHLIDEATTGVVSNRGSGSPNRLLYSSPTGIDGDDPASPSPPSAVDNDELSSATELSLTDSSPALGSNVGASKQAGEPDHAGYAGGASVWWRFTAPSDGQVTLSTEGSTFDTLLGVYTGSSIGTLTEVAANDDDSSQVRWSRVAFAVTSQTTYRVAVDGYGGETGAISLGFTWAPATSSPAPEPTPTPEPTSKPDPGPEPSPIPGLEPSPTPGPEPSPSPSVPSGPVAFDGDPLSIQRVSEASPVAAAVSLSRLRFAGTVAPESSAGAADHVVLSRDDAFPDSLAGAPLTATGPLLFTATGGLPTDTAVEVVRVLAPGGRV
jgi:subtilisin family serine protease